MTKCTLHGKGLDGCLLGAALVRASRGQGIIVSSGARAAFELRGPYDVMNLVTLCGLTEQQAKVQMYFNLLFLQHCTRMCAATFAQKITSKS